MKKIISIAMVLVLMAIIIPVRASSDYYKNIIVTFNHNGCNDQATQFMIYEYIEKEISVATNTIVHTSLCEILDLPNIINPNTGYKILIIIGIAAFLGFIMYERYKKPKKRKKKS